MRHHARRCQHCQQPFFPDKYNHYRQRYCTQEECRRVSARDQCRRWREKNRDDPDFRQQEVKRVRHWRQRHPGYATCQARNDHDPPPPISPPIEHLVPSVPPTADVLAALWDRVQRHDDILAGFAWQTVGAQPEQVAAFLTRCGEQGRQLRVAPQKK